MSPTPTPAMDSFITALTGSDGITANSLWGVLSSLVPYLKIIIPVALGFFLIRKLIKGTSKAKVRM